MSSRRLRAHNAPRPGDASNAAQSRIVGGSPSTILDAGDPAPIHRAGTIGPIRGRRTGINEGPPSSIGPYTPFSTFERARRVRLEAADNATHAPAAELEDAAPRPMSHSVQQYGGRVRLTPPVSEDTLYLTAARPPERVLLEPFHMCGICCGVKEHPVSYKCGHSYCFSCIRLWLEKSWYCPDCKATMHTPPFRHWAEEASLAAAYPGWGEATKVSYSWMGLQFPKET
ncbi:hypothetical protein B0H12DRAFT_1230667 [Mycena haematopus]|nr:hypothetical protein B0H12DRAFT_1230667 [Mycena haematopus]